MTTADAHPDDTPSIDGAPDANRGTGAGAQPRSTDEWADRLHGLVGATTSPGNEVTVLRNGVEIFPAMLEAIDEAHEVVDIVTFVYWQGRIAERFADALSAAARRGCRVRVLLDAVGARHMEDHLNDRMRDAGCDVRWFRPIADGKVPDLGEVNHRTHRKILVCDAEVGFCGGVGIADEWDGDARDETEWRDTHLRIRGPAVAGLHAAFLDNWADDHDDGFRPEREARIDSGGKGVSTCAVVNGSSETGASAVWRLMLTLISLAQQRVRIATAYFNPDERVVQAMIEAVERGVAVEVLVPGDHHDKRFVQLVGEKEYERLLDAGIRICTYTRSMMHAKVVTVDGQIATVGSTNFNRRSMQHDEEANVVVLDPEVVAELDRHLDEDFELTVALDPQRWADRSLTQRVAERVSAAVDRWI